MRDNQLSKRANDITSRLVPHGSPPLPIFPEEADSVDGAGERTDPLASAGPILESSEWPTSSELENSLIETDPFPMGGGTLNLAGDLADLFGELEPPLPRDTLPSPPPVLEEPARIEIPRSRRLP